MALQVGSFSLFQQEHNLLSSSSSFNPSYPISPNLKSNMTIGNPWAFAAGITGNIISFMVFFAPAPKFYKIYKKKTTESFDSVPYVVALFSAMLWLYFSMLTSDILLMTINTAGCVIEGFYVLLFLIYANKQARGFTVKLLMFLNVGLFGSLLVVTLLFTGGNARISVLGWAGSTISVSVFLSPLSVIRLVIRTRSVEYMPFTLSFFLTLNAIAWFTYGFLRKDFFVALPNVLGFIFGMVQMVLFVIYKNQKKVSSEEKLPEVAMDVKSTKLPLTAIDEVEKKSFYSEQIMVEKKEAKKENEVEV